MSHLGIRELEQLLGISGLVLKSVAARAGSFYRPFHLRRKGSDKWRHIDNPEGKLKLLQRQIAVKLLRARPFPAAMFGGIPRRSVLGAAALHLKQECVVSIDIRDFFPTTSHRQVNAAFLRIGYQPHVARLLTQLTTFQYRLPQGAPTSMALGNLVLIDLCHEVCNFCRPRRLAVSFYVDDITLSGAHGNVRDAIEPVVRMIRKHGYAIRHAKTAVMGSGHRQEVLKIVVNRANPSVGRRKIEALREQMIRVRDSPSIPASLAGSVTHVNSVLAAQGEGLRRLARHIWDSSTPGRHDKRKAGETGPCSCTRRRRQRALRNAVAMKLRQIVHARRPSCLTR